MNLRKCIGDEKQEVIKILNQGFNIDGVVPRCVGQNNQIKKFRSFSPKIMGGISNIDDVLFERCIKYTTERIKDVKITKYRETNQIREILNKIVNDLYIFGFIYAPKIKEIYDKAEINFKGHSLREDDLWNPLLCIAKVIDEKLEGMDDVVVELIRCKTDNETLKQKIVDLNKEVYQLKNELNSYKSVGFGLYKKKEVYVWE